MYDNGHNRMLMPGHKPALGDQSPNEVNFPLDAALEAWDLNPEDFKGKAQETRLAIQEQKRKLAKDRGFWHYEFLTDEQLTDYYFFCCVYHIRLFFLKLYFLLHHSLFHLGPL